MVEPSVKKFVAAASKTRDLIRLPNLTVEERLMGAAAKKGKQVFSGLRANFWRIAFYRDEF